jgi:hypothetical protein
MVMASTTHVEAILLSSRSSLTGNDSSRAREFLTVWLGASFAETDPLPAVPEA